MNANDIVVELAELLEANDMEITDIKTEITRTGNDLKTTGFTIKIKEKK